MNLKNSLLYRKVETRIVIPFREPKDVNSILKQWKLDSVDNCFFWPSKANTRYRLIVFNIEVFNKTCPSLHLEEESIANSKIIQIRMLILVENYIAWSDGMTTPADLFLFW